jgi:hypothetical protein
MAADFGNGQDLRDSRPQSGGSEIRVANTQDDPIALGHPLSYWLKSIRAREPRTAELAFNAIVELGPAARAAIPDLTEIVAEPFVPIRIGRDSRDDVLGKLRNIDLRAGAVDSLGAIGEAAASSAEPVIRWGLTMRVAAPTEHSRAADALLIEFVGIDVLERMRAAGAVARFGLDASDAIQNLVESDDNEKRKFAAAVLNEQAILVASHLMLQENCPDRRRGLSLLSALWPVVDRKHLEMLNEILECSDSEPLPAIERGPGLSSYRRQGLFLFRLEAK